jgi:hypothetical protein
MRVPILAALAAVAVQGCTPAATPGNAAASNGMPDEQVAVMKGKGEDEERRRRVYIAFAPQRDAASMLAMSGGRLEVEDNCLILRSELATYLPVFSPSAETYVTDSAVVIAGKTVPLGSEIQTAGGEMGAGWESLLERPKPSRCRHRLLRVSSWAVVAR